MVKLPGPVEERGRPVGERGRVPMRPQSHYQWGIRFGRRREEMKQRTEPTTLLELEELAARSIEVMEKHIPTSENTLDMVMDLLRLQYNMNFMIVCDKCHTFHRNDELIAPER